MLLECELMLPCCHVHHIAAVFSPPVFPPWSVWFGGLGLVWFPCLYVLSPHVSSDTQDTSSIFSFQFGLMRRPEIVYYCEASRSIRVELFFCAIILKACDGRDKTKRNLVAANNRRQLRTSDGINYCG